MRATVGIGRGTHRILDLPARGAIWRAPVGLRKLGDRANAGLLGIAREISNDHVLDHLRAKGRHVDLLGRGGHDLSVRGIVKPEVNLSDQDEAPRGKAWRCSQSTGTPPSTSPASTATSAASFNRSYSPFDDLCSFVFGVIDGHHATIRTKEWTGYLSLQATGVPHDPHTEGKHFARSAQLLPRSHTVLS
jgi:hypothetical protein